jgi:hypothetical protein
MRYRTHVDPHSLLFRFLLHDHQLVLAAETRPPNAAQSLDQLSCIDRQGHASDVARIVGRQFTSASQLTTDGADAFVDEVKRVCPQDCTAAKMDVNAASYATDLAPQLQTALQRDPRINFIALGAGDVFAPYAVQGVKLLGRDVAITCGEGSGLADDIKGNGVVVADVLWTPTDLAQVRTPQSSVALAGNWEVTTLRVGCQTRVQRST